MTTKAKKEIPHEELKGEPSSSDRYMEIGFRREFQLNGPDGPMPKAFFELKDKVIYPINECPHCGSRATFHRRIQESGDVTGNVWSGQWITGDKGLDFRKLDYCLDCHKEFLIELYVWGKEK